MFEARGCVPEFSHLAKKLSHRALSVVLRLSMLDKTIAKVADGKYFISLNPSMPIVSRMQKSKASYFHSHAFFASFKFKLTLCRFYLQNLIAVSALRQFFNLLMNNV